MTRYEYSNSVIILFMKYRVILAILSIMPCFCTTYAHAVQKIFNQSPLKMLFIYSSNESSLFLLKLIKTHCPPQGQSKNAINA